MRFAMFLRGVNVGGVKVPMADLRARLNDLGLVGIRTWLASGNVVFDSDQPATTLAPRIEAELSRCFGYDAHVLLFTYDSLAGIVAGCPFEASADHHRYVIFCADQAVVASLTAAAAEVGASSDVMAGNAVVYWLCPKGSTLTEGFSGVLAKARYRATTTNRNLNTLEKML